MIDVKFVGGKYVAVINGKKVSRSKKEHMDYVIRKAQSESNAGSPVTESRFSINERFGFVSDMVTMLANGAQASVVVTGPGGLGKSFTVSQTLTALGFKDVSVLDDIAAGTILKSTKTFRVIKGYSTP